MSSHLKLAHQYWAALLHPGDIVIDATCGNGHDTLYLAKILFAKNSESTLYALDLQAKAIEETRDRLQKNVPEHFQKVKLLQACHSQFPAELASASVKLIVYNLGYLPGSDKTVTTMSDTTLMSLSRAMHLIQPGGALSITCYPGHPEGKKEEEQIVEWVSKIPYLEWTCCHHRWINRQNAPSLLFMQKNSTTF